MTQHTRAKSDVFTPTGQIQFGVFFQGVNSGTIWKAAESGSQTDFESFRRIAQTAERGLFAASSWARDSACGSTWAARTPWMWWAAPTRRPCWPHWRR